MTEYNYRTLLKHGVAVLVFSAVGSQAFAQSVEPPAGKPSAAASSASASASVMKPRSRLPLAAPSQFLDITKAPSASSSALAGGVPGVSGKANQSSLEQPAAYGSSKAPYTTKRVAVNTLGSSTIANATPVTSYPFRATGRLWMRFSDGWYVCTASMIGRNVLITAAHCVHNYGQKSAGYALEVQYYPAQYTNGTTQVTPYGTFTASRWRVLDPYYKGTDTCTQTGVVCNNDLATVVLKKNAAGQYPGDITGTYAYGWNGYSYTSFFGGTVVELTQLGYPVALDGGKDMERTDGTGWYYTSGSLKNTQLGSAQTGGSSGGPWLTNLGRNPVYDSAKASPGTNPTQAVVGVTSYGSTTVGYNRQGASYFGQNKEYPNADYGGHGAGNVGALIHATVTYDGGLF